MNSNNEKSLTNLIYLKIYWNGVKTKLSDYMVLWFLVQIFYTLMIPLKILILIFTFKQRNALKISISNYWWHSMILLNYWWKRICLKVKKKIQSQNELHYRSFITSPLKESNAQKIWLFIKWTFH
jgi:hypothetical protein